MPPGSGGLVVVRLPVPATEGAGGPGRAGLRPAGSPLRVVVGDGREVLRPAGSPLRGVVGDGREVLRPAGSPPRVGVGDGREVWWSAGAPPEPPRGCTRGARHAPPAVPPRRRPS